LKQAGAERIGIGVDTATQKIFENVKGKKTGGPYCWADQFRQIKEAITIFGKGNVSVHLIVGLGETEKEAANFIQECKTQGASPALFAFTPVPGTALALNSPPKVETYRRLQLTRHLIVNGLSQTKDMQFSDKDEILDFGLEKEKLIWLIESGHAFLTSGCPDCNRPFYNEKPSGPIYNYPRMLSAEEKATIKKQLKLN
jgi:biotin synthase